MGAIVNAANCSVEAGPDGSWIVTKTGGEADAADASAVSAAPIAGDLVMRVRTLNNAVAFAGVDPDPLAGEGFAGIDHALQLNQGLLRIYEGGLLRPPSFAAAGYAWVTRVGGTITYSTGHTLATAVVKRTVSGIVAPLFFDSSLLTAGGILEVKFEPPAAPRRRATPARIGIGLRL
jgi:hypothetical protein